MSLLSYLFDKSLIHAEAQFILSGKTVCETYGTFAEKVKAFESVLRANYKISSDSKVALVPTISVEVLVAILALIRIGAKVWLINFRRPELFKENLESFGSLDLFLGRAFVLDDNLLGTVDCPKILLEEKIFNSSIADGSIDLVGNNDEDKARIIVFTSGTSGKPKGIVHSQSSILNSALATKLEFGLNEKDNWLLNLPLYHVGGLMIFFRMIVSQGGLSLDLNPSVTCASFTPTLLEKLFNEGTDFSRFNFKLVLLGGEPITKERLEMFKGLPIAIGYGMTETASHVAICRPSYFKDEGKELFPLRYKPLQNIELKIDKPIGKILIKSPSLFESILYHPKAKISSSNEQIIGGERYYVTSDMGHLFEEGLVVTGRSDRVINSGGELVSLDLIKSRTLLIDGVKDAEVIGIKSAKWGQRPKLFIEKSADIVTSEELEGLKIRVFKELELSLSRMSMPDEIIVLDKFPRSSLGKILASQLKQL